MLCANAGCKELASFGVKSPGEKEKLLCQPHAKAYTATAAKGKKSLKIRALNAEARNFHFEVGPPDEDEPEAVFFYCPKCKEDYSLPEGSTHCPICREALAYSDEGKVKGLY